MSEIPCAPVPPSAMELAAFGWGEPLPDLRPDAVFDRPAAEALGERYGLTSGHYLRMPRLPHERVPHPEALWFWSQFSSFASRPYRGAQAVLTALHERGVAATVAEFARPAAEHVIALRAAVVPQADPRQVAQVLGSGLAEAPDAVARLLVSAAFASAEAHAATLAAAADDVLSARTLGTAAAVLAPLPDPAAVDREAARLGVADLTATDDDLAALQVLGVAGAPAAARLVLSTDDGSGAVHYFAALNALRDEAETGAAVGTVLNLTRASACPDVALDWLAARPAALAAFTGANDADRPALEAVLGRVRARDGALLRSAADPVLADVIAARDADEALPPATPPWWAAAVAADRKAPKPTGKGGLSASREVPWFARAEALPPVPLGDGTRLDPALAAQLVAAAARGAKDPDLIARPLVRAAREHLAPAVRDRLGIALVDGYLTSGADAKLRAYAVAGGLLGDAGFVDHLVPLIPSWPYRLAYQRSVLALTALAATGTRYAMLTISERFTKAKARKVREGAQAALAKAAVASGMTKDAYQDTLVPDGGLDSRGGLTLSYGGRAFRAVLLPDGSTPVREFGPDGRPLPGAAGKPRKSLPAARAGDDPDAVAAAKASLTAARRALRSITTTQTRRLERALVSRREWTPAQLTEYLTHPVLGGLARSLVWEASTGERFRATEEGDLLTAADDAVVLAPEATITLSHPLLLDADAVGAWRAHLVEHDLVAPFDQLSRPVLPLPGDVDGAALPDRLLPAGVHPGTFLSAVERAGWERGPNGPGGYLDEFVLAHTGGRLTLTAEPGVHPAEIGDGEPVVVTALTSTGPDGAPLAWGELDAVLVSEVLTLLERLRPA